MIIIKGPRLSDEAKERLARYIFSQDTLAIVTVLEDGQIEITTNKAEILMKKGINRIRALTKTRRNDVRLVGKSVSSSNPGRAE